MNNLRKGVCSRCPNVDKIVKSLASGILCYVCNEIRLNENKQSKGSSKPIGRVIKKKRDPSGEGFIFEEIWNEREHNSYISNQYLGDEALAHYFAHVISKGKFPNYRLNKENIVLLTFDEHFQWDMRSRSEIVNDPLWTKMFELEKVLKVQYLKDNVI